MTFDFRPLTALMPGFLRVLKFGAENFWRNIWLSVATTLIMVVTLFIITTIVILNLLANVAVDQVQKKVDLTVYFKTTAQEDRILEVRSQVQNLNNVETVRFVSKDDALAQFKKAHQDDELILKSLEELDENPLEASLVVKAIRTEDYEGISDFLSSDRFSDVIGKVDFQENKDVIDRLVRIANTIRKGGLAVGGAFVVIAILVVFNTVRLAIYTHKEEIGIMKLVGATNWFIRGPFLLEGVFYGIIGAAITLAMLYPILNAANPKITAFFDGQSFDMVQFFSQNLLWIAGGMVALGILLGIISSSIAVGRYLRK